jgi:hypothetical protein
MSVSSPVVAHKIQLFHEALGLEGEFSASSAWLIMFKQ